MKKLLSSLALLWLCCAQPIRLPAQTASAALVARATSTSNQRYGWYHSPDWVKDYVLGEPGWRLADDRIDEKGWRNLDFAANTSEQFVTYRLWQNCVGVVIYAFANTNQKGQRWITDDLETVSTNEWVDRLHNARIKRRYNGQLIYYTVEFEPFTQDW